MCCCDVCVVQAPIPADFLRIPASAPGSITLEVNGVPAGCSHPSGLCTFLYDGVSTANVTGVSPLRLGMNGTDQDRTFSISGQGFLPGTTVRLDSAAAGSDGTAAGSTPCPVLQQTGSTQLTCRLPDAAAAMGAGLYQLVVDVPGQGYAAGAPAVALDLLRVTSVSPAAVAASGWTRVTVYGSGFGPAQCGSMRVLVGSVECPVAECGGVYVHAFFPGGPTQAAAPVRVQVLASGNSSSNSSATATVVTEHAPGNVTVDVADSASTPWVASIDSPQAMSSGGGGNLTITLSAGMLTAANTSAIYLIPMFPNATGVAGAASNSSSNATTAPLAGSALATRLACSGLAPTGIARQLTCTTGGAVPLGTYRIAAEAPGTTSAPAPPPLLLPPLLLLSSSTVQLDMAVTSVSPASGSVGGGTLLSISGSGFPTSANASTGVVISVSLRVPRSTAFPDGILPCDVVSAAPTLVTCLTRPHIAAAAAAPGNIFPGPALPQATPSAALQLVACAPVPPSAGGGNASSSTLCGSLGSSATARAVEARCAAADPALCSYQ